MSKYLAFDIEIAKKPDDDIPWDEQRPFGISCAATVKTGEQPRVWFGDGRPSGDPWPTIPRAQLVTLVQYLEQAVVDGFQIVTWNGLKFDFDVLAEESGRHNECVTLAMSHLDPMFHFFCANGYWIGLARVAAIMTNVMKSESGADAPALWAAGEYDRVLKYVAQDVNVTMAVFEAIQKRGAIEWLTRNEVPKSIELPGGVLPVDKANVLPEPRYPRWMKKRRDHFFAWMDSPRVVSGAAF